jgi:murein DD-endopeptidase MepM/ murein hydrolase activator NlpD
MRRVALRAGAVLAAVVVIVAFANAALTAGVPTSSVQADLGSNGSASLPVARSTPGPGDAPVPAVAGTAVAGTATVAPSSNDREATASPSSPGAAAPGAAPVSARGFRLRATVVPIGYPLPAGASYRYGPAWHAPRVGVPLPYESVRGISRSGALLRAHDGVDLRVRVGTPVLAAFSGVVVDPRVHWRPWAPSLYGNVVVIRSTEPTSPGYYAINAHLSRVAVAVGTAVQRGQVVGFTGVTGNAAGTIPHLHFELRAPFMIDQTWGGVFRRLDVFDPLPSLLVADPHHH